MAKKIRFPLQMNGVEVRTIEELRENFDLESVLGYFTNGKLVTWLKDRYYDDEAMAVEALTADDEKFIKRLCGILKVSYSEEENDIDIENVKRRNEKIALLKQLVNGESLISKVDAIAFDQDDLLDILDTGIEKMIYLCKGDFEIPLSVKDITYVGIENPSVLLRAYDNVNFSSLNLKFVDLCFGWDVSNVSSADRMYQAQTLFNLRRYDESIEILEKLVEEDNPRACWLLSVIYKSVKINTEKVEELSNKVADMGDAIALNSYKRKIPFNLKTLERLAEKNDAIAQNTLGIYYCNMNNYEKAVEWYRKAAEQGYAKAQYELGECYYYGKGIEQDYKKAVEWYRKAAEAGYSMAQRDLGWCYGHGEGVEQSWEKAVEWYRKAAEQGDAFAQEKLAKCYELGNGVEQNYKKALELRRKAAEQGDVIAISNIGWHYQYGKGVEQNREKAVEWYRKAAKQGDDWAKNKLKELGETW